MVSGPHNRHARGILATASTLGRRCGFAAALAAGIIAAPCAKAEDSPEASESGTTLSIATWGGAYGQSQEIAYFEPFAKETGTRIATEIYDGSLSKIKEMIGGDESEIDVVDVSAATLGTLCSDGLLEPIEASSLGSAPGGLSAEEDFFTGGISSCGIASVAWSTAIAFDRQAFGKTQPSQIADLLDTKRFPGKRALPNSARYTLELALLADGVEPANVYTELATPTGVDRAFAVLDRIKGDLIWWDNAQEPIAWLLEKKAVMAAGYSGRIFRAAIDRQRMGVIWDGQIYDVDLWAIPKGAKNAEGAKTYLNWIMSAKQNAEWVQGPGGGLPALGTTRKDAMFQTAFYEQAIAATAGLCKPWYGSLTKIPDAKKTIATAIYKLIKESPTADIAAELTKAQDEYNKNK